MSFRKLCQEMEADENHGLWDFVRGIEPRDKRQMRKANRVVSIGPGRRSYAEVVKGFFGSGNAIRAQAKAENTKWWSRLHGMLKSVQADQAVQLAEMRKAQQIEQFQGMVERHAAFGAKITAAINARELTAEQAAILENRWHHNGRALEQVGQRMGVR